MKQLESWNPVSVAFLVLVVGVVAAIVEAAIHVSAFHMPHWTQAQVTQFFTTIMLIVGFLSPLAVALVKVYTDAKIALVSDKATEAHTTATEVSKVVNGPLSEATSNAIAAAITTYAKTNDANAAKTAAHEVMKQRDTPVVSPSGGVVSG